MIGAYKHLFLKLGVHQCFALIVISPSFFMLFFKKKRRQGRCRTFSFLVIPPTSLTYTSIIMEHQNNAVSYDTKIEIYSFKYIWFICSKYAYNRV